MMSRIYRKGVALILSMIFVLIFSALAVAMFSVSSTNIQIADNHHKMNLAFASAESGLDVMRYWLSRVKMPSSTLEPHYYATIVHDLQSDLSTNSISNVMIDDGSIPAVIPSVTLDSAGEQTFSGKIRIHPNNPLVLQVYITGSSGGISRTIRVDYDIAPYEYPIFNFGLATKGPLHFPGNPRLIGANALWEADVYVESSGDPTALFVGGNTNFDGDINISNPVATADFIGDVLIAGEQGESAIANHVFTGVEIPEFPVPNTDRFRPYATGDVIDSSTDLSKGMTVTNGIIAAGTNPTFAGSVIIEGILFIESPNVVTFGRNVDLRGIIVTDGDVDDSGANRINFEGNFGTNPLPGDAEFDAIRGEVGSSIIAPGFGASFSGNFSTLDGVMAVSGVHFSGNCSALIEGTIINYSDTPAVIEGNATMTFDRIDSMKVPAGFDTHRVLNYNPSSYSIVH